MFKLYFKKLFFAIVICFLILGIYYVCYPILASISNFFKSPVIRYTILIGVPVFLVVMYIYKRRVENQILRIDYIKYIRNLSATDLKLNVKNELNYLKTFKPIRAELMAFITLILPFVIGIGITIENSAPFLVNFFAGLIIFSLFTCIYLISDISVWFLVHRSWLK